MKKNITALVLGLLGLTGLGLQAQTQTFSNRVPTLSLFGTRVTADWTAPYVFHWDSRTGPIVSMNTALTATAEVLVTNAEGNLVASQIIASGSAPTGSARFNTCAFASLADTNLTTVFSVTWFFNGSVFTNISRRMNVVFPSEDGIYWNNWTVPQEVISAPVGQQVLLSWNNSLTKNLGAVIVRAVDVGNPTNFYDILKQPSNTGFAAWTVNIPPGTYKLNIGYGVYVDFVDPNATMATKLSPNMIVVFPHDGNRVLGDGLTVVVTGPSTQ